MMMNLKTKMEPIDYKNTVSTTVCWRDAKEVVPGLEDEPIVCQTESGKIQTFKTRGTEEHWKWHVEKYHIRCWAYQLELSMDTPKEPYNIKLTGAIDDDIDKVYNAVGYTEALVDGLVKEEIAQNNENKKRIGLFIELMDLQTLMKQAVSKVQRIRNEEQRLMYGPLADRKDM